MWVSGFTSGDGSFNIKLGKNATTVLGQRVRLRFGIGLHKRELEVIKGIALYLNLLNPINFTKSEEKYKNIYTSSKVVQLQITNSSAINNIIIPFFEKYPILGTRALDFEDFKKISIIVKNKEHLTVEGFEKILKIKEGMNQNRKF